MAQSHTKALESTIFSEDELISQLCAKYYTLKNKDAVSAMSFEEKTQAAAEIIDGCRENAFYFYRRIIDKHTNLQQGNRESGRKIINLASNDYLCMTQHPEVIQAGIHALSEHGAGSGSVPMLAGTSTLHKKLESKLAAFAGMPAAISYNSGYAANYGLLNTLLTDTDVAILDMSVHASIVDGCANTNKIFFKHNDPESLKIALQKAKGFRNKLIIIDGVFSMDGDIARLDEVNEIAKNDTAWLMVDESHSYGVIGEGGKGIHSHFSLTKGADIITSSLGKSFGGIGGFVAGSEELIKFLELTSRTFIFSTSLPQNTAAQLIKAIELIEKDDTIYQKLWSNIRYFRKQMGNYPFEKDLSKSAIIPIIITDEVKLLNYCQLLQKHNVFVNPILYPVVPKKKARVRLSLTSGMTETDLSEAAEILGKCALQCKII